jgi:dihydroxyacetone kinase-like protein
MEEDLDVATTRAWIERFVAVFELNRTELTDLDRVRGDGDFGTNLQGPMEQSLAELTTRTIESVGDVFSAVSDSFMGAGGTSGPLLGVWFRSLARAARHEPAMTPATLAAAVGGGLAAVQRLGGAQVGDSTMVDAMAPAAAALEQAAAQGETVSAGLAAAAVAARAGAESTAGLVARRGRASYVGDLALGVVDPGAVAIALFFEAFGDPGE